jgi:hypothetical protein
MEMVMRVDALGQRPANVCAVVFLSSARCAHLRGVRQEDSEFSLDPPARAVTSEIGARVFPTELSAFVSDHCDLIRAHQPVEASTPSETVG